MPPRDLEVLMEKVDEAVAERLARMPDEEKAQKADKIWSMMPNPIKHGFMLMGPEEWISLPPPDRVKVPRPTTLPAIHSAVHHRSHHHGGPPIIPSVRVSQFAMEKWEDLTIDEIRNFQAPERPATAAVRDALVSHMIKEHILRRALVAPIA